MLTTLFWNVKGRPLERRIARMARAHSAGLVILAECTADPARVIAELSNAGAGTFHHVPGSGTRLHLYTSLPLTGWQLLIQDSLEGWFGFRIRIGKRTLILFAAHLPSKCHTKEWDQVLAATELARDIATIERQERHARTILVGDLNMTRSSRG